MQVMAQNCYSQRKPIQQFSLRGEESLPMQFVRVIENAQSQNILSTEMSVESLLKITNRGSRGYQTIIHLQDGHLLNMNAIAFLESSHELNNNTETPPASPDSSRSSSPVNTPQQQQQSEGVEVKKVIAAIEESLHNNTELQEISHSTMSQLDQIIHSGRLNQIDLVNVVRSCYYFEMTDFDAVMLVRTINQLVNYNNESLQYSNQLSEEFNKIIPAAGTDKLEMLALAMTMTETDERLDRLLAIQNRNKIGITTKFNGKQTNLPELEFPAQGINSFQSKQSKFYVSAIEQATLLYEHVVVNRKPLNEFFNEYCGAVNVDTDQLEYRRIFKTLLMRKVINKVRLILANYQKMEDSVPIFNYKEWNANNLRVASKVREMKKGQCVVNNFIKV